MVDSNLGRHQSDIDIISLCKSILAKHSPTNLHLCGPQLAEEHLPHELAEQEDQNKGLDVQDLQTNRQGMHFG